MLVIMALVTTFMTSPLVDLSEKLIKLDMVEPEAEENRFRHCCHLSSFGAGGKSEYKRIAAISGSGSDRW